MKVWITSVLVLFGMVELYQWMKGFTLPLPVFIVAGAALAIASNFGKYAGWSFGQPTADAKSVQSPSTSGLAQMPNRPHLNPSSTQLLSKTSRSISFTIRRPTQQEFKE
jgi:hypothetical protein